MRTDLTTSSKTDSARSRPAGEFQADAGRDIALSKVVLLAGGLGTRLAEETDRIPKPMVEIGGRPILWHIMKYFASYGFDRFGVALGYKGEVVKQYFLDYHQLHGAITVRLGSRDVFRHGRSAEDWTVHLADTGSETMTGGRVKRLASWIGHEPFLLTYGDGVCDVDLHKLIDQHRRTGAVATMTAVRPPARFGHMEFDGPRITRFLEKPQTSEGWINGGYFVCQPEVFDYIEDDQTPFECEPLERMTADGVLYAYKHEGFWQCMDTLRDVRLLNSLWNDGRAPWKVW